MAKQNVVYPVEDHSALRRQDGIVLSTVSQSPKDRIVWFFLDDITWISSHGEKGKYQFPGSEGRGSCHSTGAVCKFYKTKKCWRWKG
jgi:hypothetical protein